MLVRVIGCYLSMTHKVAVIKKQLAPEISADKILTNLAFVLWRITLFSPILVA